ncbi:hypothetical protein AVEN_27617-1 [Araneus ventricosus]|uniref:PiggyBac transposable element-derived protein domain-containing protein n=1 Tax=Araneus ventricosus TaxID=182803 RepID=A0A4Y2EMR1_ARAVE|nr:hypothetical protein AVEN_27617-1 [Araneus ventricosus]
MRKVILSAIFDIELKTVDTGYIARDRSHNFRLDDGYLFHAEPYSGSTTKLPQTSLGQGSDVVLGLMNKVYARESNGQPRVVMDNLFTSIPLLNELSKKGISGTGTVRENRLKTLHFHQRKA